MFISDVNTSYANKPSSFFLEDKGFRMSHKDFS